MTFPVLAERIEGRLAELQQEIRRLQAADALASTRTEAAAAETGSRPALAGIGARTPGV